MKKTIFGLVLVLAMIMALTASAHEHDTFMIGDKTYNFVVGSLNEPVYVDDKSGVDLTVTSGMLTMSPDGDMDAGGKAIEGLDKTLKVEISAGDKRKEYSLSPAYGKPGSYTAPFFPTVETTYAYRIFGTIDNVPVDVSFSCNPAGHVVAPEDKSTVKISDKVSRTDHTGAFGCPKSKTAAEFPETAMSLNDLSSKAMSSSTMAIATLVLAVVALGAAASMRRKS